MGSPLRSTLQTFLCHYESIWLKDCPEIFKPCHYFRYVDDTLLLFRSRECHEVPRLLECETSKYNAYT